MLAFYQMFFGQMFSNSLLRQMVLGGPRNLHHTLRGVVLILNQRICGAGGQKYAYGVALSRHFDLDVGFFPNMFWPIFFNALTRRMVLVGPRNSHHTPNGVVLILKVRICGAGGRNTPT